MIQISILQDSQHLSRFLYFLFYLLQSDFNPFHILPPHSLVSIYLYSGHLSLQSRTHFCFVCSHVVLWYLRKSSFTEDDFIHSHIHSLSPYVYGLFSSFLFCFHGAHNTSCFSIKPGLANEKHGIPIPFP